MTDTNQAMMPLPKAKRTTAKPSKAVGDEPTNQFKLRGRRSRARRRASRRSGQRPAADPPVSDPSTLEASELLEENPALNSTGNYSQPELPPVTPEIAAAAGMSQSPSGSPSAPAVEPSHRQKVSQDVCHRRHLRASVWALPSLQADSCSL